MGDGGQKEEALTLPAKWEDGKCGGRRTNGRVGGEVRGFKASAAGTGLETCPTERGLDNDVRNVIITNHHRNRISGR